MSLLKVEGLCTHFVSREGTTKAVDNVSFSVDPGKILGIVGESGSGKSVACYSLLGLVPSPPGRIVAGTALFQGEELLKLPPAELRKIRGSKIGMIFQDPMTSLTPHMTIAEQLMEPLLIHKKLSKKEARARAIASLAEVGIREPEQRVDQYPHEFSGGMRQRVMIAMALINEPELLIADEPTTALDVTVQAQILKLLRDIQLKRQLAIIFISHDLAVVSKLADHVIVMKKGEFVEEGPADKIFKEPKHPYTQKLISAVPNTAKPKVSQFDAADTNFLKVQALHKRFYQDQKQGWFSKPQVFKAVDGITLDIRKGEILGLVGESGSGKSTLGRCIVRLIDASSGEVFLNGTKLTDASSKQLRALRKDFQMIFQDPYASLNPRMTVFETLAEPIKLHGTLDKIAISEEVNRLMDEVGLDRASIRKYPHEFSGGQRQRIAIARAIACKPKFIVADEPVSALDVTIQAQILDLLLELSEKHELTMLFISHDLAVVRYVSDRVAVMQAGRIVEIGATEELYARPSHNYTQTLLSAIPRFD